MQDQRGAGRVAVEAVVFAVFKEEITQERGMEKRTKEGWKAKEMEERRRGKWIYFLCFFCGDRWISGLWVGGVAGGVAASGVCS